MQHSHIHNHVTGNRFTYKVKQINAQEINDLLQDQSPQQKIRILSEALDLMSKDNRQSRTDVIARCMGFTVCKNGCYLR